MNKNNSSNQNMQDAHPDSESPVIDGDITILSDKKAQNSANEKKENPSKINNFFRAVVKWMVIIIISIIIGSAAVYYYVYRPAAEELAAAQTSLEDTKQMLLETQNTLQSTEKEMIELQSKYQETLQELANEKAYTTYFKALNSITAVQLELEREDDLAANVAFNLAKQNIEELLPIVQEKDAEMAVKLEKRTDVVFEKIDAINTNTDMEQFRNNILKELEELLFPQSQ